MSKTLYGIYMMHPVDVLMPGFGERLPDGENNMPLVFFANKANAFAYAQKEGLKHGLVATDTPIGPHLDQKALLPGIGVMYEVSVTDDQWKYGMEQTGINKQLGAFQYAGTLANMDVQGTTVYFSSDPLHYFNICSVYEMHNEVCSRWQDFRRLEEHLQHSGRDSRAALSTEVNIGTWTPLHSVFGANGYINNNFYNADPARDGLIDVYKALVDAKCDIAYIREFPNIENVFADAFAKQRNAGESLRVANAYGGYAAAQAICTLAVSRDDARAFSVARDLSDKFMEEAERPEHTDVDTRDEEELFE